MRGRRHIRIPRAHAAVATASLVLLTMSLMVSQAHAADTGIMLPEGCTRVTLEVMPFEAAYTNEFIRVDTNESLGITNLDVGKTVQLDLPVRELVLGIRVQNTGETFTMGPASANPDDFEHARISGSDDSGWTVAFEDFLNGGDQDYNDAVVRVTLNCGTSTTNTPPTLNIPPTTNTPSTPGGTGFTGSTGDPGGGDKKTQSEKIEYTVTLGIDPASTGSGETRGEGQYAEGDEATLTALPDADSTFSRWSGDCSEMEQSASLTVVIDRDLTCPAAFDARPPATPAEDPAASVTNTRTSPATATVDESVTFRIAVTLTAVPETSALELRLGYDPGHLEYTGADWNGIALPQCESVGTEVSCGSAPAESDVAIDMHFTALAATEETRTVATATVRPESASTDANLADEVVSELASASVAIVSDSDTKSDPIEYTVTFGIDPGSTGSGETRGEGQYAEGDEATLMALPDDDSTFSRWSGDCSEMEQSASLTVVIDRDLTCPAAFDARPPATPAEDPAASVTNTRTSPATATVDESVTFRIAVTLTAVPETSALELRLGYDPGHLEYTGADWNGIALPQCESVGTEVSCGSAPVESDVAIDMHFTALAATEETRTVATATVRPESASTDANLADEVVSEPASASVAIVDDETPTTPDDVSLPRLGDGSVAARLAGPAGETLFDPMSALLLLGLGQSLIVGALLSGRRVRNRAGDTGP